MKRYQLIGALFALVVTVSVQANVNDDIARMSRESIAQKKLVSKDKIKEINVSVLEEKQKNIDLLNSILTNTKNNMPERKGGKAADGAILLVSFSMSDELLISLAQQAKDFDIPLVIKGLIEGDFPKTLLKIESLSHKAAKLKVPFSGVSIDPVWFKQFDIDSVPALVVTQRPAGCTAQKACENQPFDVVYGNASIKESLRLIADKGESVPLLARKILRDHNA